MLKKWSNILLSLFAVLWLLSITRACMSDVNFNNTNINKDTTYIYIHKTDTVKPDTVIKRFPVIIHDTVKIYDIEINKIDTSDLIKYRTYNKVYRDSNLEITSTDSVLGYLLTNKVNYRLFIPLKIYDSSTVIKTIVKQPKIAFKTGIDITPKNFYIGADVTYIKNELGASYDFFKKQGLIRYRRILFNK